MDTKWACLLVMWACPLILCLPTPKPHTSASVESRTADCPCSQVLEKVEVWESLSRRGAGHLSRCYKVRLSFLPYHYYQVGVAYCSVGENSTTKSAACVLPKDIPHTHWRKNQGGLGATAPPVKKSGGEGAEPPQLTS